MGVAAAVIAGLGVAGAVGSYNASKSQARQVQKEAAITAARRAEDIKKLAAKQRVAYVSAGLELEGTPQVVMTDTYNTGIADIWNIKANAEQQAKNIKKVATAQLLGSLAQVGANAYSMSNMGGGADKIGDPNQGALNSGGQRLGLTASGTPMWNLTGTAGSGGNVNFSSGYYKG